MGSNISRHFQPVQSNLPPSLGGENLKLLRKIQAIIDSCVGVLKQPDFLDFDNPLPNEKLSDLSHLLYQSFPTRKETDNDMSALKTYLFRSSAFSLFGHVIFNSQTFAYYEKDINADLKDTILHVITGTPGMGKTASRFPFITLLLSFGVESVKTAKSGEQAYVFKRREDRESTGTTTISMGSSNGTLPDFATPSYIYTYDVHKFHLLTDSAGPNAPSNERAYRPSATNIPEETFPPGYALLGSVSVPSVEHFPYFLRLLVGHHFDTLTKTNESDKDNQTCQGSSLIVVNRLENTKWHVVDDLTFPETLGLREDNYYVLFTSPKGSRWKATGQDVRMARCITLEYAVPKYSPQEQAALLNTMGTRSITQEDAPKVLQGVELFSFIPRFVLDPKNSEIATKKIWEQGKTLISIKPDDLFADEVSHKLIHFSCPQYDCHNWYTEFATELARYVTLQTFNSAMYKQYHEALASFPTSAEFNQQKGGVFHAFVSNAILGGFCLTSPWRLLRSNKQPPPEQLPDKVQLPKPIGESFVYLRNTVCMRKASLPDIKKIRFDGLEDFDKKWAPLFSSHMSLSSVLSATLEISDDDTLDSRAIIHHVIPNQERGEDKPAAKCFTFYLKPLGGNNAAFDSILLFFKVYEEQNEKKIDDLSVMFIQSTLANKHPISESGVNLMYLWLALLCTVYELSQQHIHPFFFFVKQPAVTNFSLTDKYPAAYIIPRENVWVMDGHARTEEEVTLARTGRLALSSATALQPNTNPTHFRCYFCDQIITESFPCHHCKAIPEKYEARINSDKRREEENALSDKGNKMFAEPQTQQEREQRRDFHPNTGANVIRRELKGIDLIYPYPKDSIPKSRARMRPFDMMDVVMVGVEEQTESPYYTSPIPNEPEQPTLKFEVSQTHPIPNIFTSFPRKPGALQPAQQTDLPMPGITYQQEKAISMIQNELSNPTSNLCTTVHLVNVWVNKMIIGFGEDRRRNGVLSLGAQHPPHEDFSALLVNKQVPLACIHLPMSFFPKQTLLLGTRQILTPFEIRGILSLVDQKYPTEDDEEPRKLMISNCIDDGQPLTPDDANLILSTPSVFSLLDPCDLKSLKTRIPTLSSLPLYDLQVLVAFVSGTLTLISDVLKMCKSSLSLPKKLNITEAQKLEFNLMKTCLKNSLTVASERLMEILTHKVLRTMPIPSDDDVELVMKGMKTNPLLPWSCQRHVIPFMTEVSPDQLKRTELVKLLNQLKTTFKRTEREVWSTILLIHAPIEETEKNHLHECIDRCLQPESAHNQMLKSLVEKHVFIQDDVDQWNKALTCLEKKQKHDKSPLDFLDRLILMFNEVDETDSRILEKAIMKAENILVRDRYTLLSLVNRKPRFPSSRREDIISFCCPNITPESKQQCEALITGSRLGVTERETLMDYVTNCKTTTDKEMEDLKKSINKDKTLRSNANHLLIFFRHSNAIVAHDPSLAILCCRIQIEFIESYHEHLF
ncbi:hypothetical protein BLNAU_13239 [Blattamonas nauphoetae]|uniref:Uncharacterized protein n=1 Tax=Blattamonas nauphoetae TaxID=2049346 RepID=A0ABQ9XK60_9EUKA|nr:hypothetical protein BLNAU_13239 [Blattamonas nauphoetae]